MMISVIIPNHNGSATIGICLQSLLSSRYKAYEVIIVDDCSADDSIDIIRRYPCRLIRLDRHSGASRARNAGARASRGNLLFFVDADCVVQEDTLTRVAEAYRKNPDCVIGGSYTPVAHDDSFYSTFQSIFINYSELRNRSPDYIASHAMVIDKHVFARCGGFAEDFMPILEDVEFSHRLKRAGVRLIMDSTILVRHIFNFTLAKSLGNAMKKTKYWTGYSLGNSDLASDSGTASLELKINVVSACICWLLLFCYVLSQENFFLHCMLFVTVLNIIYSRGVLRAFFRVKGWPFAFGAALYYCFLYPLPIVAGSISGTLFYFQMRRTVS